MADIIPKLKFPNVPAVPGVPQLLRKLPSGLGGFATLATSIGALWQAVASQPTWGIFDSKGKLAVSADSIVDFDYRQEFKVSNFPVQDGKFASYNKVNNPFDLSVRLSKSGTKVDRAKFLQQIETLLNTLDLYKILTPEKSYLNCNLTRYEVMRRGPVGAYFLTDVDLFFMQILPVTAQYTTTAVTTQDAKQPGAKPPVNLGALQPQAVATAVVDKVKSGVSSAVGRLLVP